MLSKEKLLKKIDEMGIISIEDCQNQKDLEESLKVIEEHNKKYPEEEMLKTIETLKNDRRKTTDI